MCDPVTAAVVGGGMLASGVSTYNQTKSANRNLQAVQTAKENAFNEGINRQNKYAAEAGQAFNSSVANQGADSFNSQAEDNANKRLQAFNSATTVAPDYVALPSTPKNVAMSREKAFNDAKDKVVRNNEGIAKLSGYSDTQFNQGLNRDAFGRAFGNLADKAGRDARLVGMDMDSNANNARKGPNAALSLVKTAGQLASMYGSSGATGSPKSTKVDPNNIKMGAYDPTLPWNPQPSAFGGY